MNLRTLRTFRKLYDWGKHGAECLRYDMIINVWFLALSLSFSLRRRSMMVDCVHPGYLRLPPVRMTVLLLVYFT